MAKLKKTETVFCRWAFVVRYYWKDQEKISNRYFYSNHLDYELAYADASDQLRSWLKLYKNVNLVEFVAFRFHEDCVLPVFQEIKNEDIEAV